MEEGIEGTTFGRYRVGRLLGSGGMGAVYAGVQEPLGRPVAIKVLRPEISENAHAVARFKREAELAASLSHPNIAQVTDFGVDHGRAYLVMDLLEGVSLAELIEREGRLSEARVQRIAMQVLTALSVAHERGVVHRDLKPENIFVQQLSGMELVKLLDFGIAHLVDLDHGMTSTGAVVGTPAYMSPEQARGRRVDARSDVFSMGGVLYEMLSGRRPFEGANYHELMFKVVEETPTPLAALDPETNSALAQVVERAMNKTPESRYASAKEMRGAMETLTGLREGGPGSAGAHASIPPTRHDASAVAMAATMASSPDVTRPIAPPRRLNPLRIGAPVALLVLLALGGWAAIRGDEVVPTVTSAPPPSAPPPSAPPIVAALPPDAGAVMRPMTPAPLGPVVVPDVVPLPALVAAEPLASVPPPAPHASHAGRPRDVIAHCGPGGDEVEMPTVGVRDHVSVSSAQARDGLRGSISAFRAEVHRQASDQLTQCYRGHPILQGQDFTLFALADGTVQRVEPRVYCPIPPAIEACARRALSGVVFPSPPDNPFSLQISISIQR